MWQQAQLRRQIKEERERHTRQAAQLEAKITRMSTETDQQLQQQLLQCQSDYDQKLQEMKVVLLAGMPLLSVIASAPEQPWLAAEEYLPACECPEHFRLQEGALWSL